MCKYYRHMSTVCGYKCFATVNCFGLSRNKIIVFLENNVMFLRCGRCLQFYLQSDDCVSAQVLPRILPRSVATSNTVLMTFLLQLEIFCVRASHYFISVLLFSLALVFSSLGCAYHPPFHHKLPLPVVLTHWGTACIKT